MSEPGLWFKIRSQRSRRTADEAAALFYGRLFALDPSLRSMFPEDLTEQGQKLMQMLAGAVKGLDRLERLVPAQEQLAVRHVGYGVKSEHDETVGAALIWTLEQGLGDLCTDEFRAAWGQTYALVSGVMIDAAEAAEVESDSSASARRCPYHGSHVPVPASGLVQRSAASMA